jgi:hypothetical protein
LLTGRFGLHYSLWLIIWLVCAHVVYSGKADLGWTVSTTFNYYITNQKQHPFYSILVLHAWINWKRSTFTAPPTPSMASWQGAPTTSTFNQLTPQGAQGACCTCWISCRFFRVFLKLFSKVEHFLSCQALCKGAIAQLAWGNHSRRGHLCSHRCKNRRNRTETPWRVLKNVLNNHTGPSRTYQDGSNLETIALILPLCEVRWSQSQSAPDRIRASTRWCCRQSALYVGALVFFAGSAEETELHIDQIRST